MSDKRLGLGTGIYTKYMTHKLLGLVNPRPSMSKTTCEEAGLPGLKWPINFRELMLLMHTNKILAGDIETVVGDEFYGELIVVCGVSIDPKVQFGQPQVSGHQGP